MTLLTVEPVAVASVLIRSAWFESEFVTVLLEMVTPETVTPLEAEP